MPLNMDKATPEPAMSDIPVITKKDFDFPVVVKKIRGTTYIVTGQHSPTARETAVEKMKRIILNDPSLRH